jgi:hypothetical protein
LPRDLADVLHYFMPEIDGDSAARAEPREPTPFPSSPPRATAPTMPPLQIIGIPIGDRDVVRAALAWNLAVETARLGDAAVILAPVCDEASPLWPEAGEGPLGTELVLCPATDLSSLCAAAKELARSRADTTRGGGIVFVRVPPDWIASTRIGSGPIRWWLLLTSANRRELHHAYDVAKQLVASNPEAHIGATIHGVTTISEAHTAFEHLARISDEGLGLALRSYGLLVDDLHVYRAIAAQRPIGLAHPQAPATKALMDVARLLTEDARSRTLG